MTGRGLEINRFLGYNRASFRFPDSCCGMSNSEKPVKSPCVFICALNEEDVCMGCYRTGQEISRWGRYSNDERREVLKLSFERARKTNPFL